MKKQIVYISIGILVVALLGWFVISNRAVYNNSTVYTVGGAVGDVQSTYRVAGINVAPATDSTNVAGVTASSTAVASMYNNDDKDRIITGIDYYFTGLGKIDISVVC